MSSVERLSVAFSLFCSWFWSSGIISDIVLLIVLLFSPHVSELIRLCWR